MKAFLNKIKPKLVRIGVSFLLAGLVIMAGSFFASGGKLGIVRSSGKWQYPFANDYVIKGGEDLSQSDFSTVIVDAVGSRINLIPSDRFNLDYAYYKEGSLPLISTEGGVLSVTVQNSEDRGLVSTYGFGVPLQVPEPEINLYFPAQKEFDLVSLRSRSGIITGEGIMAKEVTLYNRYSSSSLTNLTADRFTVDQQSASIHLEKLSLKELDLNARYGSVNINDASITQSALFNVESGSTNLTDVTATNLKASYKYSSFNADQVEVTNLDVSGLSGSLNYDGKIYGQSQLSCQHSSISLDLAQPRNEISLEVSSKYGSIDVDGMDFEKGFSDNVKRDHALKVTGTNSVSIDFS